MKLDGEGEYDFEIVGESFYQAALDAICGGKCAEGHEHYCEAEIVMEDDNQHDANAVAVFIEGRKVGHLSRDDAPTYRRLMAAYGSAAQRVTCDARITGGWDRGERGEGDYGVELDIGPPEVEAPQQAARAGCLGMLAAVAFGLSVLAWGMGSAAAATEGWDVQVQTSALDGARTAVARLEASNETPNIIGRPERAALMLRCQQGVLEAYVVWPLPVGLRQAWGAWKVGDGQVVREDFTVSTSGDGTFWRRRRAEVLMQAVRVEGGRLVVRVDADRYVAQEAVFDLAHAPRAVDAVRAACSA